MAITCMQSHHGFESVLLSTITNELPTLCSQELLIGALMLHTLVSYIS